MYPSLGPLLTTVARMVEELIAFLFPMFIVMGGFAVGQRLVALIYGPA